MTAFAAISPAQVDPELRRLALLAADVGTDRLDLDAVTLHWVLPADGEVQRPGAARHLQPSGWTGWIYRDEPTGIYVRADLPGQVMPTVLHELRHLAQLRDGRPLDEDDAEHWAQRVMNLPLYQGAI